MSTSKKTGGLKALSISRLADIVARLTGERVKKYKDKNAAIKALGNPSKQNLVQALLETGGATAGEIEKVFGISRTYARDIISKLVIKGVKVTRDEDSKLFTA